MGIRKEELIEIESLFVEISNIISSEGVEFASDHYSFFNPVKLGRELEQINYRIETIKKTFGELVRENIKLFESITNLKQIPKKDLELFVTGDLSVFAIQMQQIMDEKKEKYKDVWKDVHLNNLRDLFDEKISEWRSNRQTLHYEREKRLLLHIANYCYFLHCRILEIDKK